MRSSSESLGAALLEKIEELSFLRTVNDRLSLAADFPTACRMLVELLWEERSVDAAAYVSVDHQRRLCRLEAVAPQLPGAPLSYPQDLDPQDPALAPLLAADEPVTLAGVAPPPWLGRGVPGGVLLGTPLRLRGSVTGLLLVHSRGDARRLDDDRRLLAIVASCSALALDVSRSDTRAEFLAMLRHDISNPVSVALGYGEILLDQLRERDDLELVALGGSIVAHLEAVADLVANYLHMAAIDRGTPVLECTELDLGEVTRAIVARLQPAAEQKGLRLDLRVALAPVRADRRQLDRIVANLVGNAIKYTPAGRVEVEVSSGPGGALLRVADTGYGLGESDLARLFTKYARFHRDKGIPGTGLGLHLTRTLVEAHGGSIAVASAPGEGTTFTVRLPAAASA